MPGDLEAIGRDESVRTVELPRPTVAPMVLALGIALLAVGIVLGIAFMVVGATVLICGLGLWIIQLPEGRGEVHEAWVDVSRRPQPVKPKTGGVGQMQEGMPGYRLRLPTEVHPISAGIKGGILGGLLMPIPAILWSTFSGHGLWYPVNLIAGLVLPGVGRLPLAELEQFQPTLLVLGLVIHAVNSVVFGLIYGVLLPTLPSMPKPIAWGGLAMPILWTTVSFSLMDVVNPALGKGVAWPWFIASQFVFGVVAASVSDTLKSRPPLFAGLIGGGVAGLFMPLPALLWSAGSGRGIWYPANLLAAMLLPGMDKLPTAELNAFRPVWLTVALAIHIVMSLGFGAILGLYLPRIRPLPSALGWGALLLPLLWTAVSYGLMGIVNPLLQERVHWPWFVASQFVFGIVASVVVHHSERVHIPAAGPGPNPPDVPVGGDS